MKSYTYAHILPNTGEVIYVGSGRHERAWSLARRSAEHVKVINNILEGGSSPADYVVILAHGLSAQVAASLEVRLIRELRPLLNRQGVSAANAGRGLANHNAVLSPDRVRAIRRDHAGGAVSIRALARHHGVAYSTARKVIKRTAWGHVPDF